MKEERLIQYALDESGSLKYIDDVETGISCKCRCPSCKEELIAKNKGKIQTHHFSHKSGSDCVHGYQTSIHLLAKEIFKELVFFQIPGSSRTFDNKPIVSSRPFSIMSVVDETRLQNIIPDILLTGYDGSKVIVEILVTHAIDNEKMEKLDKIGIDTVEIDLSKIERNITRNELENEIISGSHSVLRYSPIEYRFIKKYYQYGEKLPLRDGKTICPKTGTQVRWFGGCNYCSGFGNCKMGFIEDHPDCCGYVICFKDLVESITVENILKIVPKQAISENFFYECSKFHDDDKYHIYHCSTNDRMYSVKNGYSQYKKWKTVKGFLKNDISEDKYCELYFLDKKTWTFIK